VVIDGRVSETGRSAALATFEAGKARYLIGQISAIGTALDGLQRVCKRVVFVERIGSPALMEQAVARAVRRGQKESVLVETLRADHRLEDITDATLSAKKASHGRINE
jgi:superfamily II DNA or RNA helicase